MTQEERLRQLATTAASALKATRTLLNGNATNLNALQTTARDNLVAAINELKLGLDTLATTSVIDDGATTSANKTYSVSKIRQLITDSINALEGGASTALDTLGELAAAIGNDANFAATITQALGNRVRTDTDQQGLSTGQKAAARKNIDAYGSVELGNPDTDFALVFTTGLS